MFVYTYWDSTAGAPPRQAEICALWERGWRARGWEPRLLTERIAKKNPDYRKAERPVPQRVMRELALDFVKGKFICPVFVINFAFAPGRFSQKYVEDYGRPGWKTSALVDFGWGASANEILNCGRALKI